MVADQQRARTPRRAPTPEERTGPAQQTRERILAAAVAEFGAKGYAGARTAGIAARAQVNQQLISYHFGGKRGLLEALRARWAATEATLVPPGATFAESTRAYLDATLDHPSWARLVIWQALGDDPDDADPGARAERATAQRAKLRAAADRVRQRQHGGELTGDVDAEFILLLAHVLVFAPIAMPQVVADLFGSDPGSQEFRRRCLDSLLTLLDPGRRSGPMPAGADDE